MLIRSGDRVTKINQQLFNAGFQVDIIGPVSTHQSIDVSASK